MTTDPAAPPATRAPIPQPMVRPRPSALMLGCTLGAILGLGFAEPAAARPSYEGTSPACFLTAAGALEICRDGAEAEGVLAAPPPCAFARGIQLYRLRRASAPGPIQAVFQGESPLAARRGSDGCPERRSTDPRDGGTLRTGRSPEQLALTLPPAPLRFGVALPEERRQRGEAETPLAEGIGPRDPVAVSGRDWAGEEYTYIFMLGQENTDPPTGAPQPRRGRPRRDRDAAPAPAPLRRVQIEARTLDFAHFEIRTRTEDGYGLTWSPVSDEGGRRQAAPIPAAVLDEGGKPVTSACAAPAFATQGLSGSISIVDQTYHYFYTDTLPEDCALSPEKRRTGLFLRTAKDLAADKVWSAARRLGGPLPPGTLIRVARAKDAPRWAVSYTCYRPANAPGGPVADICLQYTNDLDPASIAALTLYADPVEAGRSPAYLGLRSGGDGGGRFDRAAHFWMTDSHGNLDVPATYAGRSGLLTWVDRLAPGAGGAEGSRIYGRPAYWATWTVRRIGTP